MSIYDKASLVLIPSGTKTSKVYSQKPTNGDGDFTFSRSTAATRVNASGNIEKETSNLLLQSNTFDTTWVKVGYTLTSGQAGYDSTNDAWLANCTGAGNALYQTSTATGVSTFSIYVKAGTAAYARLRADQTTDAIAVINLSDGSIESESGTIKTTATDVGGGWYRCAITWNIDTLSNVQIRPSNAAGNAITGTLYIQDAQLEQGLVARDYIETTTTAIYGGITDNVPRLDYTDSSCPSLLLEPQRTNLVTQSEYQGSSDWSKTNVSVTSNAATSPQGVSNATEIIENSSTAQHFIGDSLSLTSGTAYSVSVYAKKNTRSVLQISPSASHIAASYANYDLENGVVSASGGSVTTSIEDAGDGWYRCVLTFTATSTATATLAFFMQTSTTASRGASYAGDGSSSLYVYGFQVEAGSYPTSYIPTYGSAVTRNADTNYIQNTFSGLSGANSLTIFFEVDVEDVISLGQRYSLLTDLTGSQNWIFLSYESSGSVRGYIRENSSVSWDYQWSSGFPTSGTIKAALVIPADGNAKLYGNGLLRVEDSGAVLTAAYDTIAFGGTSGAAANKQRLKQFMIFPTALTDQEAIDLTTL